MRRITTMVAVALLGLAACGDDATEAGSGDRDGTTTTTEAAADSIDLGEVLSGAADTDRYRLTQTNAQTMESSPLGPDTTSDLDSEDPAIVGEADGDRSHLVIDLSSMLATANIPGDLGLEMWLGPDRVVIDSTSYQTILDANPAAALGPFTPGVSYVDLTTIEGDAPGLVAALVGSGVPDLGELADGLDDALDDVERDGDEYSGTTTYAEFLAASGVDIEVQSRSVAGGLALNLRADVDALTELYASFYRDVATDVTIEAVDGELRSITTSTDLSGIWARIFDSADDLGIVATEAELDQAREQFADTVWILESRYEFEADPDLEVPAPPAEAEDRTQEWIDFLVDSGFEPG